MAAAEITAQDLQGMVGHWLGTPAFAYLGSDYGNGLKGLLQTPLAAGGADAQIALARRQIPVLGQLPPGAVNLYAYSEGADQLHIVFQAAGVDVTFTG